METGMADDKGNAGGQDRTRINTSQDYEVQDWSKKFGVSAEQLKAAVKAVGSNAKDVESHLKGSSKRS
jgi:hypothetical protein